MASNYPTEARSGRALWSPALRIALIYALASVAWILLSDHLAAFCARGDESVLRTIQSVKGLIFVLASSGLILALVLRQMKTNRRHQQMLIDGESHFRELFENAPTAYQSLDEQGILLEVNAAWLNLLGYEREEVIGKPVANFLEPSQIVLMQDRFPKFKASGRLRGAEFVFNRHDGKLVTVTVDGRIQTDADGAFQQTHCVLHDITDRKQSEVALRNSEQRLLLALDSSQLGTFEWDIRKGTMKWDQRHAELFGVSLDGFGETYEELINCLHPDDRANAEAVIARARKSRTMESLEFRVIWPDESIHWIQWSGRFYYDPQTGAPLYAAGVALDTDDRRELEEQLRQAQKMEAVGQLAGGVAHDFNNLLQVINGYSELALADLDDDHPATKCVTEVGGAGKRAATLVTQLLAFSRRQVIDPEDMNLNKVIESLLQFLQRTLGDHITIEFMPGHQLGTVNADRGQLEQVLMNLCINARDAMIDGGTLTIETENVHFDKEYCQTHAWASPGRYMLLSITDTGSGMDRATLERIWEPFFTTKEPGKGTGLGLSTVYGIVRQHDGLIHVYSELQRGTTFKVYLPLVERPAASVGSKVQISLEGGTETILVGEDSETVRELIATILTRAGYNVITADDGVEALRIGLEKGHEIDLVLLDVVMPGLGGREVHDQLKAPFPDLGFLFASGYSLNGVHTNFVLDEGFELIQKPFDAKDLLIKVRRALDGDVTVADSDSET